LYASSNIFNNDVKLSNNIDDNSILLDNLTSLLNMLEEAYKDDIKRGINHSEILIYE
jgi:hypothetical protein